MTEVTGVPGHPEIPSNWEFSLMKEPGLRVRLIDVEERFLSADVPGHGILGRALEDYFFDEEGRVIKERTLFQAESYIQIPGEELNQRIDIERKDDTTGVKTSFSYPWEHREQSAGGFSLQAGARHIASVFFGRGRGDDPYTASVNTIRLDNVVLLDPKTIGTDRQEQGPGSILEIHGIPVFDLSKFNPEYICGHNFNPVDAGTEEEPHKYLLRNVNTGENEYSFEWKLEGETLVAKETHLGKGISRTVRTPLHIELDRVKDAAFLQASKNDEGKLYAPWRDMDKLVGVRLNYSQPLPKDLRKPKS